MDKEKIQIKQELKELIAKSNSYLNSNHKQQAIAYLYIIFSFIALSFFGLFAVGPTITTISQLNKQYEEDKTALKQLQDKNAALKSLSTQYVDIQQDLQLIENAIPQEASVAQLTRQLEQLSVNHNLVVQKLDTGLLELFPGQNTNAPLFSYSFSVSVAGSEADINEFIKDFINMERIIAIDKLTTGKQSDDLFSTSINGKAYFYHE